ncbi:MAG TPA: hypothetical protein VFM02_00425 [Candidatus Paceibacterota bacterium]|nr:hypothetical protein [Candidatus Paceibacterota bacterium]
MRKQIFSSTLVFSLFVLILFGAFLFLQIFGEPRVSDAQTAVASSAACERWNASNIASSDFYSGFGVPWDVLSSAKTLLMRVACGDNGITLIAGSGSDLQYIWKTAYISKNGGSWTPVVLQGGEQNGNWFVGNAFANIISPKVSLTGTNYLLTYICTWSGGTWKCGCRDGNSCTASGMWQLQEVNPSTAGTSANTLSSAAASISSPTLFYPSKYVVSRGEQVLLSGGGLSGETSVTFEGYGNVPGNVTGGGTQMSFVVPGNIPYGRYNISINGNVGKSNASFLVVKDPSVPSPSVSSMSALTVHPGQSITLTGSGFAKTGNEIRTNLGIVSGISSQDGKTLTFTFPVLQQVIPDAVKQVIAAQGMSEEQFLQYQKSYMGGKSPTMGGSLRVVNQNGISEEKTFTIQM